MSEIFSAFNSERPYETPPHAHEEFMFLIPERGVMRFTDEETNRSTTLARHQFLVVPPGWLHSTAALSGAQCHLAFYVEPDDVGRAFRDLFGDRNAGRRLASAGIWEATSPIAHLLLMKKEYQTPIRAVDRTRQMDQVDRLLLLECIATSISHPSVHRSSKERHGAALVREVCAHLAANLEQAPSLDALAEVFKVSRRHLTRLFSDHMGHSILDHVQRLRIQQASELLRFTNLSILEIAQTVGFRSQSHFAKIFARETMMKPDEWRRNRDPVASPDRRQNLARSRATATSGSF